MGMSDPLEEIEMFEKRIGVGSDGLCFQFWPFRLLKQEDYLNPGVQASNSYLKKKKSEL